MEIDMPKTQVHTVMKGENLDKIAKSYGLKSFKDIFNDPVNAKFRKQRPKSDLIQPGDKIIIPNQTIPKNTRNSITKLIKWVEDRIRSLEDDVKFFEKQGAMTDSQIANAQSGFKKTSNAIDAAAFMIGFMRSLSKIVSIGAKQSTMTAAKIAESNKEVVAIVVDTRKEMRNVALGKGAEAMTKSTHGAVAAVGIIADSYFKISSPSFWGSSYMKAYDEGLFKKLAAGKFGESWDAWSKAVTWEPNKEFAKMRAAHKKDYGEMVAKTKKAIATDKALLKELQGISKM
ncbi:MAG: LysM peptidoglycan-binding domain-containing protein [Sulfitobacter sp.]